MFKFCALVFNHGMPFHFRY